LDIDVELADDGAIASTKGGLVPYDIALIDIQMPNVDGLGVAKWVQDRWHGKWARPPIVAVSANALSGIKEKCLKAGRVDFISKPINLEGLAETISRHFKTGIAEGSEAKNEPAVYQSRRSKSRAQDLLSQHVDWKNFISVWDLSHAKEDLSALKSLLENYRRESKEILTDMETLLVNDYEAGRRKIHKLKGSSGSLGLKSAFNLLVIIHNANTPLAPSEINKIVPLLKENIDHAGGDISATYPSLELGAPDPSTT
jgi:CheY-like chemotaxis protein